MHPHREALRAAGGAALGLLLCILPGCAVVAQVQTPCSMAPGAAPLAAAGKVHTDAAGNLHFTPASNGTVLVNGVDLAGELAALQAAFAALLPPAPKVFSSSSQTKVVAPDAAPRDQFGCSVAVRNSTLVVGARLDDDAGMSSGAAYVFGRSRGGCWTQQQKLVAADAAADAWFGHAVAMDGATIAVGAYQDDDGFTNSGSVYVFTLGNGGAWAQQQKLTAGDAAAQDEFGSSVAVSGNTVVAGSPFDDDGGTDSGAAYVYQRSGTTWAQQQKLTARDGAAHDQFGSSVAVSGAIAVVGAWGDDDVSFTSGSAYVFELSGGSWAQRQKLAPSDHAGNYRFGFSVAISGGSIAVGAQFSANAAGASAGAVYVFTPAGSGAWAEQQKLTAADGASGDEFGYFVAISGNTIAVSANRDDDNGHDSGSAYVFTRTGTNWTQQAKLLAADGAVNDLYGFGVATDGHAIAVGAVADDDAGTNSGSAYVF